MPFQSQFEPNPTPFYATNSRQGPARRVKARQSKRLPWCLGVLVVKSGAFTPNASGHVKPDPKKSGLKTLKMYTNASTIFCPHWDILASFVIRHSSFVIFSQRVNP